MKIFDVISAIAITIIAAWHYYWALGGKFGMGYVLPQLSDGQNVFQPTRTATLMVAVIFSLMALLIAARSNLFTVMIYPSFLHFSVLCIASIFFLRAIGDFRYVGFFKKVRGTCFSRYDTYFYSPISLALSLMILMSN